MQKLIIKNKYQSPNRMNILTAAGIAQINEPIFPQNGERIWGGLGVVTFNQASQYSEEENPDAPITPPNCVNCGGGITPIDPPPSIISQYISQCNNGIIARIVINNSSQSFKLIDDASHYIIEECHRDDVAALIEQQYKRRKSEYPRVENTFTSSIVLEDPPALRYTDLYIKACYNRTNYSDGTSINEVAGYTRPSYSSHYAAEFSDILTIETVYTDGRPTQRYQNKYVYARVEISSGLKCDPCY